MAKEKEAKKIRRKLIGNVVSFPGEQTVKIRVERKFAHPKYGKIVKTHKTYIAHLEDKKDVEVGNVVEIEECAPISAKKTWIMVNKIK